MKKTKTFIESDIVAQELYAKHPGLKKEVEKDVNEETVKIALNKQIDKTSFTDIKALEEEFYRRYPDALQKVTEEAQKMIEEFMHSLPTSKSD